MSAIEASRLSKSEPPRARAYALTALLIVLGIGTAVYLRAAGFGFVELDDTPLILENPYVNRGITPESVLWAFTFVEQVEAPVAEGVSNVWAPLAFLSHSLDVELWGLDPSGHHLTSVVIHLVTTGLVFFFFLRLSCGTLVAGFVAAVFCFHPMRVESVAWIAERKDVLSGLFIFLCLILYHAWGSRAPTADGSARHRVSGRWFYAGALLAFVLGCMAKPATVFLPGLLIVMDVWPLRRYEHFGGRPVVRSVLVRQAREKWPFLLVAIAVGVLSIFLQYNGSHSASISSLGLMSRILEMPGLILYYLERTFFPMNLFPSYPRYPHGFVGYSALAIGVLTGSIAISLRFREKFPSLLFGWIWFLICLSPVLGIIYVGPSFSSDRYTYIAHCGLAFALAHGVQTVLSARSGLRVRFGIGFLGISVIAAMAFLSYYQVGVWRNTGSLYRQGVRAQPQSSMAWHNLGAYYFSEGKVEEALKCFRSALRIGEARDTYFNLGLALKKTGAPVAEQAAAFRDSLRIDPDYVPSLRELGLLLTDSGSGDFYIPAEGCRYLEHACDLLNYYRPNPTADGAVIIQRLLQSLDAIGDREGFLRVLTRAEEAAILSPDASP